jgi:hypothetical protein
MDDLYRDGLDSEGEFNRIFDIASGLWSKQKKIRDQCVERLSDFGVKSVSPILYTVECKAANYIDNQEEYDNLLNSATEALKRIGRSTIPVLERYVLEDNVHLKVNDFTQVVIFEVLGLKGNKRQNVCKHGMARRSMDYNKTYFTCIYCGKIFDEDEW